MKLFGKNVIERDTPESDEVILRIEIQKKGDVRLVKALVIRCIDSKSIHKSEYETSKSDLYSYNVALESLEKYAEYEGLEIVSKSTNIDLPYVKTSSKRMR